MAEPAKKTSPAAMLIALGGLKKKPGAGEPDADDTPDDDSDDGAPRMAEMKSMAASDAMDAVKSGDAAAFEDALTRFFDACSSSEGYGK